MYVWFCQNNVIIEEGKIKKQNASLIGTNLSKILHLAVVGLMGNYHIAQHFDSGEILS